MYEKSNTMTAYGIPLSLLERVAAQPSQIWQADARIESMCSIFASRTHQPCHGSVLRSNSSRNCFSTAIR